MSDNPAVSVPRELNCEQCRELLNFYADRELTPDEQKAVERHMLTCQKCATESTCLHGIKRIVQNWDGVRSNTEFRKSVMQRFIRESQMMSSTEINRAAEEAAQSQRRLAGDTAEAKSLPPIWILLAAAVLAVLVYYGILWLRGMA